MSVFDIETDGIDATKIHCLSVDDGNARSTTSYDNMRKYFTKAKTIIGHNIVLYDIPVVERLLGIEVKARIVDTMALSWYLYPKRVRHGLEWWGEDLGVAKPKIDDWENLSIEEYIHRCEEDVKINKKLWKKMWKYLLDLYGTPEEAWKLIDYLTFKMQCVAMQERNKWKLDVPFVREKLSILENLQEEKTAELKAAMPKIEKFSIKKRPAKPFKKDGSLSALGEKWFALLEDRRLPKGYTGEVKVHSHFEEPKPSSPQQIKDWLFSLGWKPQTFKFVREDNFQERKIPQIKAGDGGDVCRSIQELFEKEPALESLQGLSIIAHRIGLLKGFLRDMDEDGYLKATVGGFTNTLRLKHKEIVNLPGVDKPYGDFIRGSLIAPDGYELCGSDMAALEDRTKQHYMLPHDPDYVAKMQEKGYCPHIDIAKLAGYIDAEQENRYKTGSFKSEDDKAYITAMRKKAKPVNYGGVYGQKPAGLARSTGMPIKDAEKLHEIYWERNWSVKKIAEEQEVKTVNGQMWLFNPVSQLWYSLRFEKDRFSTLNQGTGAYCFDMWVKEVLSIRPQLTAQFHDEICLCVKKGNRDKAEKLLKESIKKVNENLKLNRELDIDVQFGNRYSEIH